MSEANQTSRDQAVSDCQQTCYQPCEQTHADCYATRGVLQVLGGTVFTGTARCDQDKQACRSECQETCAQLEVGSYTWTEIPIDERPCCHYPLLGCTDPTRHNYLPYAEAEPSADRIKANMAYTGYVEVGACGPVRVTGCTYPHALNYNPWATVDAGDCIFIRHGCKLPRARNFDASVTMPVSDLCEYDTKRCALEGALNFDPAATLSEGMPKPKAGPGPIPNTRVAVSHTAPRTNLILIPIRLPRIVTSRACVREVSPRVNLIELNPNPNAHKNCNPVLTPRPCQSWYP